MRALRTGVFSAMAGICLVSSAAAQQYAVTDLGNLTGFTYPAPSAINNLGQVAGTTRTANFLIFHPFRTAPNSPINPLNDDLGLLPGATSASAASINILGQVVGTASIPIAGSPGFSRGAAFRADPGNPTPVSLGTRNVVFGGIDTSVASAINNSGQVTGEAASVTNAFACSHQVSFQAFRTLPNGPILTSEDLGTMQVASCGNSQGFAINSSGQVAGDSNLGGFSGPPFHASLASPGMGMQDLGTLGAFGFFSRALSINDAGQVVGESDITLLHDHSHAFLVNPGTTMQDLGTLGGTDSIANSINNGGQIVGNSLVTGNTAIHAFLYRNATMTDLNSLIPANSGWVLQNASAINDVGQIVGTGRLNGVPAAFRLDPPGSAGIGILLTELINGSLGLTRGEVISLGGKLVQALISIFRNNLTAAAGQLSAFINQVNALVNSSQLSAAQAAPLISEATNILNNF